MNWPHSLSTDQLAALVELNRQGSLRGAAEVLLISEQGIRNRLISLEQRLGVQLYHKRRGVRRTSPLTREGTELLPHAVALLERASEMCAQIAGERSLQIVHVVASHYLTAYVLIAAVQTFQKAQPDLRVRLSTAVESEIEQTLLENPHIDFGVAAPYDLSAELEYEHLLSMDWSLIARRGHPLVKPTDPVQLSELVDQPLIVYEQGSTGRQHVMEAFWQQNLPMKIELEVTSTDIILRMVEADLGIALVPLIPGGIITRGRRVGDRRVQTPIRSIDSGVLRRKGQRLSPAARQFLEFIRTVPTLSGGH